MALDDYCVALVYTVTTAPIQRTSTVPAPAVQSAVVAGPSPVSYDVRWDFGVIATAKLLVAEFEAVGFTKAVAWTPPGGTLGNYRFTSFRPTFRDVAFASITATLSLYPGV